jgi:hypothetical protein
MTCGATSGAGSITRLPLAPSAFRYPSGVLVGQKKGYTHFAEGDVGLAKITPCFENGKSTVFRNLTGGIGAGTTELHIVRPIFVDANYILIFLKSPHFIETGIPKMTGTAGQKRVPFEYFAYSPFPLPPLAEQHRIVAKVDELMALCDRLETSLAAADDIRRRLLDAGYSGRSLSADNRPKSLGAGACDREGVRVSGWADYKRFSSGVLGGDGRRCCRMGPAAEGLWVRSAGRIPAPGFGAFCARSSPCRGEARKRQ